MKILDVLNAPWAIIPDRLNEIQEIYFTHLRGEKIDLKLIEAQTGKKLQNEEQGYEVHGSVAVVPIEGVIAKKMNLFSRISGGASTQLIERDIRQALADPEVKSIILSIDSPGGTVDGTQELANFIYSIRGQKPLVTHTDGSMASGAYWIGSAANQLYISGDTVMIGSIGVVAQHVDYSKAEADEGIRVTEITAGKYKRIASQHAPLTEEGRAVIQEIVDDIYTAFVNDVARNRGTSADDVLSRMADGKIFIGKKSIEAGLVDGVSTLSDLIDDLNQKGTPQYTRAVVEKDMQTRGFLQKL
jgi:signal peptide peptidase SppA